ncbi:MAG: asparagine--tRNA ligase [Flavobacteriales bacterium]
MAAHSDIVHLFKNAPIGEHVTVKGWVRTFRNDQFLSISDGSTIRSLQIVVDASKHDAAALKRLHTGAAVSAIGAIQKSLGKGQDIELICDELDILGDCDPDVFPIQMKRHSLEFLREKAHLRFRTNTFGAVFRIRHHLAFAIHKFFNDRGFFYLHAPIITGSDAEGAGEMFRVTNLDLDAIAKAGKVDHSEDFFGKPTNLTVSGQLEAELAALALGKVYTFGPTFRAENSNTSRHLAEFWMIEPEVAFNDIYANMDLGEACLKFCIQYALDHCQEDLVFLQEREQNEDKQKPVEERQSMPLLERLNMIVSNDFVRITYTEAIDILMQSPPFKKKKFKYPVEWGIDMQSEHERYLVEKHFQKPVIITGYPAAIKAFYMRLNEPDSQGRETVAAMDILVPGIGEIIGGSQREERYEMLLAKCRQFNIPEDHIWWYLETRQFGTCVHAGFGMGFERLIMFVTGMGNIRDVIPFPRTPQNAEF